MEIRAPVSLSLRVSGRVIKFGAVSIDQPRTVFLVLHYASPLVTFFKEIGSSLATSSELLVRNSLSNDKKGDVSYACLCLGLLGRLQ